MNMAKKKENKSAKIRALLDKGVLQKDIVKKLGVSAQLVYIVARNHGALATTVKRIDDRAVLDKIWSILNEHRRAA